MERIVLPEIIETDRLLLRPFRLDDVDEVLDYARDPEWARFIGSAPYEREDAERAVAKQILMDRRSQPNWAFVFEETVIGGLTMFLDFEHRSAEIGYSVGRRHWNKGFCTEAVRAVITVAFSNHRDLNRIHAKTDPANVASQRVLEKVGMVKEGVLRSSRVQDGEAFDEACFSILRSEQNGSHERAGP